MAWLAKILNITLPCVWKCCENSEYAKINKDFFWNNLIEPRFDEKTLRLLHQQNIYLSEKYKSILSLGIDPRSEFQIIALLDLKKTNDVVLLNSENIQSLLQCLNQYFAEKNISFNTSVQGVRLTATHRIFKLYVGTQCVNIDEDLMYELNRMSTRIEASLLFLERKRKSCESALFYLLKHYCYKKTVKMAKDYLDQIYIQHFFDEMLDFHCKCIDQSFIREIATNFSEWFEKCVPTFIQTIMLIESVRLQTFSSDWPYDNRFVDVKIMAKSGLYFTGSSDRVKCAFCGLMLHKWNSSDNPVQDHWTYSPKCVFLNSPKHTYNVPDEDSDKNLEILLLTSKTFSGYDEIDV